MNSASSEHPEPPRIIAANLTKKFGSFVALDDVSMTLEPCTFHTLLGENGAGKSTLVKCIMGYYKADQGTITVGSTQVALGNPRDAQTYGIGMVYQHFTLVQNMTVAENFLIGRRTLPWMLNWKQEHKRLDDFLEGMPFRVDPHALVRNLAAGQRQKVEILKQLYLDARILILDEPTSVLTPAEADEILGMLHAMTRQRELSVLLITHKFKHVMQFADEVTVLRRGKFAGRGKIKDHTTASLAEMMIGKQYTNERAARTQSSRGSLRMKIENLSAEDESGKRVLRNLSLSVHAGEIVGIAGVSGNGQRELVEVLSGQRMAVSGQVVLNNTAYSATRKQMNAQKISCLPEEPLKNACVSHMSVIDNLGLRNFDRSPYAVARWLLNRRAIERKARELIEQYCVRTPSPHTPIGKLSGGNVQRSVLARDLSNSVEILVVANPVFGLDFASVAAIHSKIVEARNNGAAVLLISEDLDELLELCDRILVMFGGEVVHETPIDKADLGKIGAHMAGVHESKEQTKTLETAGAH